MASCTVRIFSASSSLILTLNSSPSDMISSTRSSESAFKSSMKLASGVTSSSLTLNCSAMIFFRRSSALAAIVFSQAPFSSPGDVAGWLVAVVGARRVRRLTEGCGTTAWLVGSRGWRGLRRGPLATRARLDRSTEDTIDEFGRGFTAEELGQFNRLVYRGPERHCSIAVQGFIESDAQNVTVDGRHLRQGPERRPLLNERVDGGTVGEHSANQLVGVRRGSVEHVGRIRARARFSKGFRQAIHYLARRMMAEVHLVQRLKGERAAEAAIEKWTWRKHPPQLLERFVQT